MPKKSRRRISPVASPRLVAPTPQPTLDVSSLTGRETPSLALRLARRPRSATPVSRSRVLEAVRLARPTISPWDTMGRPRKLVPLPTRPQTRAKIARQRQFSQLAEKPLRYVGQGNVCQNRATRRQVMFAQDVAGKKWGSGGGPSMKNARRSVESAYSCVR